MIFNSGNIEQTDKPKKFSGIFLQVEVLNKVAPRSLSHALSLYDLKATHRPQPFCNAVDGIGYYIRATAGLDFSPYIHFISYQHRDRESHGLSNCNPKILLMGRQYKEFSRSERPPLFFALQHSGPVDAMSDTKLPCGL